ncbi:type I 3-dehydroquinate dehydratase [Aminivibrio sp.]
MRPQPKKPITARGKVLGGPAPLVCVPLVGKTEEEIRTEARNIPAIAPDAIELRVDAWDFVEETGKALSMIGEVRTIVGELPVILTCRGHWEGGVKKVADEKKFLLYKEAAEAGFVDFIDMELACGDGKIREILAMLEPTSTPLIISCHDFEKTPSKEMIFSLLGAEIRAGAHVAKFAAMPRSEEDVLSLLSATLMARRQYPGVPLITMSMGETGAMSRITGGLFGSDLTFAVGSKASAPGQIPVAALRQCLSVIFS